ncbi:MAG: tetratricopeptide repeat protein [Gammaproteobacteria bacterium]|nr:tetratricopeptide repeat protein [Gammaproteobacteria bacterium]
MCYHRHLPNLIIAILVIGLAGCASSPRQPVLIEDHTPAQLTEKPTPSPVQTTRKQLTAPITLETKPKIFALPDLDTTNPAPVATTPLAAEETAPKAPSTLAVAELVAKADLASNRGDRGGARAILERALKVKTDDAQIWYRLAELNLGDGEYEQAIVAADRARGLSAGDSNLVTRANSVIARARQESNR